MAVTITDIKICAAALQLAGAEEITSFEDETREARICASLYPTIKADLLQSHTWRFSIRQEELNRLASTPLFGFSNAYSLPADFLRLIGKSNPTSKHQLFENKVYTDLTPVYASIQYNVNERFFPAYFEKLIILEMAVMLSTSLLEDVDKSRNYATLAKNQMVKARNIDSQNNTASIIPNGAFNLTNVRY
jgi:hypothetical protein